MPIVTLTTDFGISSPYVAQVKGVLLSLCPDTRLIDITHGIHPQNVAEGAVVLADVTPLFPAGSLPFMTIVSTKSPQKCPLLRSSRGVS